ncbi:dual specificity mitogen-activated protein kinase kinase 7-like [Lineus longissimus]|uniref:dual specificity mitogen-activated protein kinase kinase 7-like n=1 Tax=Lineus longissimus TaxID=88925 RepID=UPI002B4F3DF4
MATSSTFQNKLNDLEARLKAENDSQRKDRTPRTLDFGRTSPSRPTPRPVMPPNIGHGYGNSSASVSNQPFSFGTPPRSATKPTSLSSPGSATKPTSLSSVGSSMSPVGNRPTRKRFTLPMSPQFKPPDCADIDEKYQEIMKQTGMIAVNGQKYPTDISQLTPMGELGHGTCGQVVKMRHEPSGQSIAVKQMRRSGNREENKRIIMDLDVVLKCSDCPFIVKCTGAFITPSDVWICMELMSTCFDKLIKRLRQPVPERILGKTCLSTLKALNYLKEVHGVIHRDIKPSNILLDELGRIKLCDFGISGRLVDSKAKTRSAGCAAYMAPERIDPPDPTKPDYDIRADVWSLGITLVELATGEFPYRNCKTDFDVLTKVLEEDPPLLPSRMGFSMDFCSLVRNCLTKDFKKRPKYKELLEHNFIKRYEMLHIDVSKWYKDIRQRIELQNVPYQQPSLV